MLAPSLLDVVQRMLLIIKFVGGKFRDLEVNHEIWHPTNISCYIGAVGLTLLILWWSQEENPLAINLMLYPPVPSKSNYLPYACVVLLQG